MSDTKTKYVTFRDLQQISRQSSKKADRPSQAKKKTSRAIDSKQSSSEADLDQRSFADLSPSANQSLSANQASESVPERVSANQSLSAQLALTQNIAGHTAIPNLILDGLMPQLRVQDQAVYLR